MARIPAILFLVFVLPALAADDKKTDSNTPAIYTSKAGRFTILLRGKPIVTSTKVKVRGSDAVLHIIHTRSEGRSQVVTYMDYPLAVIGTDREKFLAAVVERNLTALKGASEKSNVKVSLDRGKHPGRDVRAELTGNHRLYRARVYLVGERLYQIIALDSAKAAKDKETDAFLNSFAVTN